MPDILARWDGWDPNLQGITSATNKDIGVCGINADAHHITQVVSKFGDFRASLNIPHHAGHVTRRGDNFSVVHKTTA